MGIVAIINMLLPVLANLLGSTGATNPALTNLISQLGAGITTLIANLIAGKSATSDITAVLQAIQAEVNALKAGTSLFTLNEANCINALDKAVQDALTSYTAAQATDNPALLTPLTETL